ncbi:hypothetical protein BS50DRAFT_533540 [Corynespora cassiicola Philippines]|uniref:Homeobox domain-containing protein n=1 Tax=Corynespora cassiicola Philippines TaxID=1448308 RepID=A0A2T2N8V1_CORCC|nr:hypothetical protein BS50DRAFT_533540 [Corynespora cassiicola Philippines]
MAPEGPLSVENRNENIKRWQLSACYGDDTTVSASVISAIYDGLMISFKTVLAEARHERPEPQYLLSLEQCIAALFFWGQDFSVLQGELDTRLQYSHRLRETVLTVLVSLADLLVLGLIRIVPTPEKREALMSASKIVSITENAKLLLDDPIEPPAYGEEDLKRLCMALVNMIESLKSLNPSLEVIAEDEDGEEAKAWVYLESREAHEYFVELISLRFPSASQQLAQTLGRSNWARYDHIKRLREGMLEEPKAVVQADKPHSEFHDSGVGTSIQAQSELFSIKSKAHSEYAVTVVSRRAKASHKRIPPLPEVARLGEPFECEVCRKTVQIKRTKDWKKHVFEDICAYTCIYIECSMSGVLFRNREAMTNHLVSHHNLAEDLTSRPCPLCLEDVAGGRDALVIHFARHMEEIALGVLPHDIESDAESTYSEQEAEPPPDTSLQESDMENCGKMSTLIKGFQEKPESATVKCVCGYTDDVQGTVLCKKCGTLQHITCYYASAYQFLDIHECNDCGSLPNVENQLQSQESRGIQASSKGKTKLNRKGSVDARDQVGQEFWQCTFCRKRVIPESWKKHEETHHKSQNRWVCMLSGPNITLSKGSNPRCAFCLVENPSKDHLCQDHRIKECSQRPASERTFLRPRHLLQHLVNFHRCTGAKMVLKQWKTKLLPVEEGRWTCGFCGEHISSWDHRETHIADHFKEGLTMNSWTESAIAQVPNSSGFMDLSYRSFSHPWYTTEQDPTIYRGIKFEPLCCSDLDLDLDSEYEPCIHGTLYGETCKDCNEDLKDIQEAKEAPNQSEKPSTASKMLTVGASHGETQKSSKRARQPKLPIAAIKEMQSWLDENMDNPYPSNETKRLLAQNCGITERQVTTWFTNARAGQLSPTGAIYNYTEEDEKEGEE